MKTIYGLTSDKSIADLKRYYYGAILDLLYKHDDNYPLLDQRTQTLINQLHGSLGIFNNDARVLSIIAWLEDSRVHPIQFRKNILDAANAVDDLGGESDV